MSTQTPPIIVIKKKGGHGGHHGGAWKVAYADFVTAMMSLFIVLWLMGSSEKVKKAVAGYFNDPKGTGSQLGTTMTGTGEAVKEASTSDLEKLKEKLEKEIQARKDLQKLSKQIEITVTPEGLRIELLEGKNGTFYELGSPKLSESGQELLALLASELKTLPNSLLIEGHTDSTPYSNGNGYSNWDLSADRANSARRLLQQDGVRDHQVTQVRGYADMMLRDKADPTDPSNRRVSLLIKNDTEQVPELLAAKIVDGTTPLPGSAKATEKANNSSAKPSAASGPEKTGPEKTGLEKKDAQSAPPASPANTNPPASTKQAAKPSAPTAATAKPSAATAAAKPGLLDRLKSMLPGHKK
jgi:chemotaxis protein MotB